MSTTQRSLLLAALALMLFGVAYGTLYTYRVEHQTLLVLREGYQEAFASAAARDLESAKGELAAAKRANQDYVRSVHIHTHLIKLAIVVLLLALMIPLVPDNSVRSARLATGLVIGILLFTLGVYLQGYSVGMIPESIAATGALLIIGCFAYLGLEINKGLNEAGSEG
jgi:hypothetical protein